MLDMICNYCGKKYKDEMMDGSVCPKCDHIFKLYDDNDKKMVLRILRSRMRQ